MEIHSLDRLLISRNLLKTIRRLLWQQNCVGQKRCYFKKQTGEVIDNKGSVLKNKAKQTEKQSGEVVENT